MQHSEMIVYGFRASDEYCTKVLRVPEAALLPHEDTEWGGRYCSNLSRVRRDVCEIAGVEEKGRCSSLNNRFDGPKKRPVQGAFFRVMGAVPHTFEVSTTVKCGARG